jgi:hypothetical protein
LGRTELLVENSAKPICSANSVGIIPDYQVQRRCRCAAIVLQRNESWRIGSSAKTDLAIGRSNNRTVYANRIAAIVCKADRREFSLRCRASIANNIIRDPIRRMPRRYWAILLNASLRVCRW